ncbi:hypothetical protein R1sor_019497 [Riccia sorocarpa]|uniref:Myb/SANT-like DNA-binding domain-containing protein n=1 Tax=Riccia sorocarpa TaxID=122646 RepID=A0ABD3ICN7_9MARC
MDARRASFEGSTSGSDNPEPLSPAFIPCNSPSADNTPVMLWSQVPNSQPMFPFMDRPIPLRHPYLQAPFVGHIPAVRTSAPFQVPVPLPPVASVPAPVNFPVVDDTVEAAGGQHGKVRTTTVFTWDHQAILFLIDAKQLEWEEFENTAGRRGVMITAAEKWKRIQDRLASNGVFANVSQIRSKWERLAFDFKKVGDHNKQSGNEPYSSLTAKERRDNRLPANFPKDLFDVIDMWMHRRHSVSGGGISESGASVHEGVHTPTEAASQSGVHSEQLTPDSTKDEAPLEQPPAPAQAGRSLPPDATGISNSETLPLDRCLLIGVLCAVQTVIDFYEDEEDLLSKGPIKRCKTGDSFLW